MTEITPVYAIEDQGPRQDLAPVRNCPMGMICDRRWDDLPDSGNPRRRACGDCRREVVLCRTRDELAAAVYANECVAVRLYATELVWPAGNPGAAPLPPDEQGAPVGSLGCGIHGDEHAQD